MKDRIVIAMSGGVDSSATAAILKERGYDVIGIAMHIWNYSEETGDSPGSCCSMRDIADARGVAERLKIPFYVLNLKKEFKKEVIDYFISEYMTGRTPNPCVLCNQKLKFDILMKRSSELNASLVATGHYAEVVKDNKSMRYTIKRGMDKRKDQSYFLFNLTQDQLKRIILPLGRYLKSEVRELARTFGLKTSEKTESQDICFIPDNNYPSFIQKMVDKERITEGEIVNTDGKVIGHHRGIPFYTIGQRKGIGISSGKPIYVIQIDTINNRIVVGEENNLEKREFYVEDVNWCLIPSEKDGFDAAVQIRYRHSPAEATIIPIGKDRVKVEFRKAQRAITPGQAAVFYQGDLLIGGGWIRT